MLGEHGLMLCLPSSVGIPVDAEVSAFETYLARDCSAAENTMIYQLRYVREFLLMVFGSGPVNRHQVSPKDLMSFVAEHSTTCLPGTVRLIASCLRSYTRFLALQGTCGPELTYSVPSIPCWRLSSIPGFLTDKELDTLLAVFDRSTATGRRDYAMALCMAELALRTGEVASLNLESIDWRHGTLAVRGTKSGRDRILPLCQSTGEAIAAYLTEGRPASMSRALFLRHRAPAGLRVTYGVVRGAIRRACASAEIVPPRAGPRALRHTAATRMVNRGAALSDVADILGHASIETTRIYAKVDLVTLSRVALPWPGGVS
jgi:site-specific recombinase XerD